MHMEHAPRAGALVEIIDILGDDQQFARPCRIEPRQRLVRGIGPHIVQRPAPCIVEVVNQRRIAREGFWGADILDTMIIP